MRYGYARVSTKSQDFTGQVATLKKEYCDTIAQEKFTGTKKERPIFTKLLEELKSGDTLVVTKLDRLARNTKEGIEIVENLFERDVKVHVLNVGLLENTTMGRFFLQTMLAVSEMERNLIIERTQEGKTLAKQRDNFREGRPSQYSTSHINNAMELLEKHSYKQVEELTGISKSTLIRTKRKKAAAETQNE